MWVERIKFLKKLEGELQCQGPADFATEEKARLERLSKTQGYLRQGDLDMFVAIRSWEELKKEKKNAAAFCKFAANHELLTNQQLSVIGKSSVPMKIYLGTSEEDIERACQNKHFMSCVKKGAPLWEPLISSPITGVVYTLNDKGEVDNRAFVFVEQDLKALVVGGVYGNNALLFSSVLASTENVPTIFGREYNVAEVGRRRHINYNIKDYPREYYDIYPAARGYTSEKHFKQINEINKKEKAA